MAELTEPLSIGQLTEIAGNLSRLAQIAGVSHSTVCSWKRRTGQVPIKYAKLIRDELGVPLHLIRPDIYDPPKPRQRRQREGEPALDA